MEEKPETTQTQINSEVINTKLNELFGEDIAKAFADEDINCYLAIADLLDRDSDSPIIRLTYGKTLRFKDEFEKLIPRALRRNEREVKTPQPPSAKPSMGELAGFSPEVRRQYLSKRKHVGVLATKRWKNKYPKFNTPELKAELKDFAREISDECSLPEAGLYTQGIEEHVKHFFNEQRRANKNKIKVASCCSSGSSSEVEVYSNPKLPSMPKVNRQAKDQYDDDDMDGDSHSDGSNDTVILNGNELDESQPETSAAGPSLEFKISKKSVTVVIKSVTGKVPERDYVVKLLKGKFQVPHRSITALTPSQLMETRKLISHKYVLVNSGADFGDLKKADLNVRKEIDY